MTSKKTCNSYKRYCCAYGCLNKRKNNEEQSELSFFKIPEDMERRQEWLTAIDREDLLDEKNKGKHNFVCSAHFDDSTIITSISKRLKNDAVPTISLPHKSNKNQAGTNLSKKDNNILVSTYSHTHSQTDSQTPMQILPIKEEIDLDSKSKEPSEPTTSASQSQTRACILSNKIKKPKVSSTSTQTDLNETSNKTTQTISALALTVKSLRKRKLKKLRLLNVKAGSAASKFKSSLTEA